MEYIQQLEKQNEELQKKLEDALKEIKTLKENSVNKLTDLNYKGWILTDLSHLTPVKENEYSTRILLQVSAPRFFSKKRDIYEYNYYHRENNLLYIDGSKVTNVEEVRIVNALIVKAIAANKLQHLEKDNNYLRVNK